VILQLPNGKQIIFLSSDTTLTGAQVIEAYGWRFKIEVSFRSLVQLLGGFDYRFWLRSMTRDSSWPKNLVLADFDAQFQAGVATKIEAFERFVNLNQQFQIPTYRHYFRLNNERVCYVSAA